MWPALMLAASRNESVIGRTEILVVSIRTKKGFSQNGAPPGRIPAAKSDGEFTTDDRIRANHKGRARDKVKYKWLDVLNT